MVTLLILVQSFKVRILMGQLNKLKAALIAAFFYQHQHITIFLFSDPISLLLPLYHYAEAWLTANNFKLIMSAGKGFLFQCG